MNTYKVELEKSAEELADEIINGVWGCGAERRDNITKKYGAAAYKAAQTIVNERIRKEEHKRRGWCTQFEKAKKRREDFIEELQGLERAQGTAVILDEISIYSYSCPTCQIKVMLNGGYGETVTCPVCERRIYRANDGEVMKVARGSRQAKVNNHYIQLDSYGRFED